MISCISRPRTSPHPLTGDFYEWAVVVDGDEIPWQSYAGPLRFDETDFAIATRKLLSIEPDELPELVGEHVEFSSPNEQQPRLMVHSTTPYASSFETDLTAMVGGAAGIWTSPRMWRLAVSTLPAAAISSSDGLCRGAAGRRRVALSAWYFRMRTTTTCRRRCCAARSTAATAIR